MRGIKWTGLVLVLLLSMSGTAFAAAPSKVAVIIMENRGWAKVNTATAAPYIFNTIRSEGISIDPSPTNCNYPSYTGPGTTGTIACNAGMFQNLTTSNGFLMDASGPEYAWLVMGVNANTGDGNFPNSSTSGFVIGYPPAGVDTTDPATNLFKLMESESLPFTVWAEDYPGTGSSCFVGRYSNSGTVHNFYARRHNPYLLVWDQSPDAKVVAGQTPSAAPSPSLCETHMKDFPNNTPNSSVAQVTNFSGSENFDTVNFIVPSLCHDMHNPARVCNLSGSGDTLGGDNWLKNNLPGIRKDVGSNGVVVITWDENGPGQTRAMGTGFAPPIPAYVLPGTDGTGTPGVLSACGTPPCVDNTHFYSQESILKAILDSIGASCANLDNNYVPIGQTQTAMASCEAANEFPIGLN